MEDERRGKFRERLLEWAGEDLREFPWRESDATPFEVFVAEVLLQRTFAAKVEEVYLEFLEQYPTPKALAEANRSELTTVLQPLGLQNRRAVAFGEIASTLVESGGVPRSEGELLKLPRVGPYVANATLCFGFGERRPIVDTNVARIYARVFDLGAGSKDDEMWEFAEEMLPEEAYETYNLALLDFGALVCTAQSPACETCPMSGFCSFYATET